MNQSRAIVTGLRTGRARPLRAAVKSAQQLQSPRWLFAFLGLEIACQLGLLLPSIAGLRVFIRTAAFLGSVFLLVILRRGPKNHPSSGAAMIAVLLTLLSFLNPSTNTPLSGVATIVLEIAVLGPIFWVPRIRIDVPTVRRLFLVYWSFSFLSGCVGVLQVYFPGRFDPVTASVLSDQYLSALHIVLADGTKVFRPMGLTDTPGGASFGASFTIVFAVAFLLDRPKLWFRILLLLSIGVSCFMLYLCQVRCAIVSTIISLVALGLPFIKQRRFGRYLRISLPLVAVAVVTFIVAVGVGGQAVTGRLSTLINDDASTVYYTNRGKFLSYTLSELLPQYPLGAGLGRWGMIGTYFSDFSIADSRPLWAEIQWTGWLFDGGVPLMLAYGTALVIAMLAAGRAAIQVDDTPGRDLYKWATVALGYIVGIVALTFNCCPFVGTLGIDCWFLSGVVFAASQQLPPA